MRLVPGARLGSYEIVARIGVGGMGEVYRAIDTRLRRAVAIKVLPEGLASDADRLARFQREAEILASLNHPNIATLYGIEDADSSKALVMELVEGPTVADRIAQGRMTVDEALVIAKQIAEALEAAHERGIIHRDLKPANIKLRPDGKVKVLDFGLAKALEPCGSTASMTESPTVTAPVMTQAGVVLGTAAYMSPEQARGQPVDQRTDIWALGCVLYEMLSGRTAFGRATGADTLAAVIEGEPDLTALPALTPPAVRRLVQRCLTKDPRQRMRDAGDARLEIDEALTSAPAEQAAARRGISRPAMWGALAVAAVALAMWLVNLRDAVPAREVTRTTITLPTDQRMDLRGRNGPLALSPDGRRLVYSAVTEGTVWLHLRNLESFEDRRLAGTEGAWHPFFSRDGRWVAFFAGGRLLRVSTEGGAPIPVCEVGISERPAETTSARTQPFTDRPPGVGGTWGPDDTIVFPGASGLLRVNAAGGTPVPFTSSDPKIDGETHSWPQFLPDGRGLLSAFRGQIAVLSVETGEWRILGPGNQARFLSPGYVIFHGGGGALGEGELFALPFDVKRLVPRGAPAPFSVLSGVFRGQDGGAAYFAMSETGTLVFARGGQERTLVRVDRQGRRTPLLNDRRAFRSPRFSPDGRRIALSILPRPGSIWVYDLDRQTGVPLAGRGSAGPVWNPDGKRVAYLSGGAIKWKTADGSAGEESLVGRAGGVNDWSRDGRFLAFVVQDSSTGWDIWVLVRGGDPRPIVATAATEVAARFSPDGRWIAYQSCAQGRCDVLVRPFPDVNASLTTVSTAGGGSPVRSPDGRELFYLDGTTMMAVSTQTRRGAMVAGAPARLFDGPFDTSNVMNYDVAPDGMSFVMIESDPNASPNSFQVVQHWVEELKRLVPVN